MKYGAKDYSMFILSIEKSKHFSIVSFIKTTKSSFWCDEIKNQVCLWFQYMVYHILNVNFDHLRQKATGYDSHAYLSFKEGHRL